MLRVNTLSGFGRFSAGGGYDADAEAFFTAAGITDDTQKDAVNQLVLDIKAISSGDVWTNKLKAIYPLVGGSSSTHAVNLRNPGTHDITWSGTVTHDSNGITPNGTTGYGDTGFNQSTHGAEDDEHVSIYSRTNANITACDIGATNGSGNGSQIRSREGGSRYAKCQDSSFNGTANSDSLGYFSINRTASTGYRFRQNATNTAITQASDQAPVSTTFHVGARNTNGTAGAFSSRNFAWCAIGRGLTESEDGDLRTAVETYQDALSRGVVA